MLFRGRRGATTTHIGIHTCIHTLYIYTFTYTDTYIIYISKLLSVVVKKIIGLISKISVQVWRFLKKLEIELPYDPAIPLLDTHTEETRSERDTCTPMFIAALFIIART